MVDEGRINRLHNALEKAAEEIENCYGRETELSNELRELVKFMPEYEKLKERDRAKKPEGKAVFLNYRTGVCPICGNGVISAFAFCDECGQRIDWSEQEI